MDRHLPIQRPTIELLLQPIFLFCQPRRNRLVFDDFILIYYPFSKLIRLFFEFIVGFLVEEYAFYFCVYFGTKFFDTATGAERVLGGDIGGCRVVFGASGEAVTQPIVSLRIHCLI